MKKRVVNIILICSLILFAGSIIFAAYKNSTASVHVIDNAGQPSSEFNSEKIGLETDTGWVASKISCKDTLTNKQYCLYDLEQMSVPVNSKNNPDLYGSDGRLDFNKLNLTDKIYHETSYAGDGTKYDSFVKICSMKINPYEYKSKPNKIIKKYVFYQLKNEENPVFYSTEKTCTVPSDEAEYLFNEITEDDSVTKLCDGSDASRSMAASDLVIERTGINTFNTIVLVNEENTADNISAVTLSGAYDAPILYYTSDSPSVNDSVMLYIKEHLRAGGTVYVIGGTGAIPSDYEASLKSCGFKTARIYGVNRYITNLEAIRASRSQLATAPAIIVASGENPADAVSISGIAAALKMPIYLTGNEVSDDMMVEIEKYDTGRNIIILGGESCVSSEIEETLKEYGSVKRISGSDRYETSLKIAEEFSKYSSAICIADGNAVESSLSASFIAKEYCAPVLLYDTSSDSDASISGRNEQLQSFMQKSGIKNIIYVFSESNKFNINRN